MCIRRTSDFEFFLAAKKCSLYTVNYGITEACMPLTSNQFHAMGRIFKLLDLPLEFVMYTKAYVKDSFWKVSTISLVSIEDIAVRTIPLDSIECTVFVNERTWLPKWQILIFA